MAGGNPTGGPGSIAAAVQEARLMQQANIWKLQAPEVAQMIVGIQRRTGEPLQAEVESFYGARASASMQIHSRQTSEPPAVRSHRNLNGDLMPNNRLILSNPVHDLIQTANTQVAAKLAEAPNHRKTRERTSIAPKQNTRA